MNLRVSSKRKTRRLAIGDLLQSWEQFGLSYGGDVLRESEAVQLDGLIDGYARAGLGVAFGPPRAIVTFPAGFDPSRTWPILIVTSTSDFNRTSAMDADWYRKPATAEGWVVLGSDATISPRIDSTQWRLGLLGAALEAIRKDWPQFAKWPVAFAGFSGGSKRSGVLGAMLARSGSVRVCGFFLSGINEDRLGEAYKTYQPGRGFLEVPVWLSSGASDTVATPAAHNVVKASLERTGFKRVRLEQFGGGHQLKMSEVRRALQWFRQLGRF